MKKQRNHRNARPLTPDELAAATGGNVTYQAGTWTYTTGNKTGQDDWLSSGK